MRPPRRGNVQSFAVGLIVKLSFCFSYWVRLWWSEGRMWPARWRITHGNWRKDKRSLKLDNVSRRVLLRSERISNRYATAFVKNPCSQCEVYDLEFTMNRAETLSGQLEHRNILSMTKNALYAFGNARRASYKYESYFKRRRNAIYNSLVDIGEIALLK